MEFYDVIFGRESIRDYDPNRPVELEKLKRILEAGQIAPSAANKQPWKFLLISSNEMLEKVRECYLKEWFKNAPHILVVVGDVNEAWRRKEDGKASIETDLTIAMDHMILAAENEGVGTCWIAAFNENNLRDALELKDNEVVFAITPLGYPNEGFQKQGEKNRKSFDIVVKIL
ncbi:MAG: nitroreductase family protein [Candidatus Lokiarchaeota archaeon]|nr:nitroreductase family protein [Candidatus Lokiarchaeota archaeon]